jgi:hypothetical protein
MTKQCGNCQHFIDHSQPDDEPKEANGYCSYVVPGSDDEKYGGHWTRSDLCCDF